MTATDVRAALVQSTSQGAAPMHEPRVSAPPPSAKDQEVLSALEAHRWNRSKAAHSLGISRTTLWRALLRLGIDKKTG